ncbi:UPF0755 protein [Thermomonospora echinospora]|uniref:Endolytic murein transglycosylase n=1 Tax=Thermomonospora echinospora TaxID=1992 RepID=A0A1H6DVI1_9ACTN|nr:endolytic transglycosylase MltG [Thermomonospora echinospora]SEG89357.1 UPF0755 protein [Thermomonospora echinospora]
MNDLDLFEDPAHRGRRDGHQGRRGGEDRYGSPRPGGRYGRPTGHYGGPEEHYDDRRRPPGRYDDHQAGPHDGHQEGYYDGPQEGYYDGPQGGHYDGRSEGYYEGPQGGHYDGRSESYHDGPQGGRYDDPQDGHYDGLHEDHHQGLFEEQYEDEPDEERPTRKGKASVRKRQRKRKASSRAAVMFSLAFLVAVFGGGGLLGLVALEKRLSTPDYSGQGSGQVTVQIKDGDTGQLIGQRLEAADVVKSSKAYVRAATKEPRSASIQPGFYAMRKKMSAAAALGLLLDPKSRASSQITIPEGLRVSQTIERLSKKTGIPVKDFEAVVEDPKGLGLPSYAKGQVEGYLWPGRYDLDPNAGAEATLKTMVDRFKQNAEDLDLENRAKEAGMKPGTAIAMASIIQAESGKPSDMPKISEVIYNRLKRRMQLQMDSTVMYALKKFGIEASHEELNTQSPYNTYRNHGLPPGAISSPGAKAIEAVFKPSKDGWLFFVTTNPEEGLTEFSKTQEEHDRLVDKYNRNKQNGGD